MDYEAPNNTEDLDNTEATDNTDKNFNGQQAAETVLCFCRKHPIVLLRSFLVLNGVMVVSVMGILAILNADWISGTAMYLLLGGLFILITFAHHTFYLRLFHYFLDIIIFTNYRIIDLKKSVYLLDDKEIIDLHEIQDIKKNQQGIIPNLLNYGEIKIATASLSTSMSLPHIPKPEYYLNQINQAKRFYILTRRQQKSDERQPQEESVPLPSSSDYAQFDPLTEVNAP